MRAGGWGNVITEAAAMAKAIVASDRVGAAFDIVEDDRTGFLVDSRNLDEELEASFMYFLEHREAPARFGREARRRYERLVDPEVNVRSLRAIIDPARGASDAAS